MQAYTTLCCAGRSWPVQGDGEWGRVERRWVEDVLGVGVTEGILRTGVQRGRMGPGPCAGTKPISLAEWSFSGLLRVVAQL